MVKSQSDAGTREGSSSPLEGEDGNVRDGRAVHTSESVTEGHPDKVCDLIADSVLDAHLEQDRRARVACEVLAKGNHVVLAGEITSRATVDHEAVVRRVLDEVGYAALAPEPFRVVTHLSKQSPEIAHGVAPGGNAGREQGAGDQGIMVGYATDETDEFMPLPILLAHRLARTLARHRKEETVDWLRPDGKTLVSVAYEDRRPTAVEHVLVSTQHGEDVGREEIVAFVRDVVVPEALGEWHRDDIRILANPAGTFVHGGTWADAGLTGRKNVVDSYGGAVPHGGGGLSGKDPSKVDRSGAYFCRFVARRLLREGIARRAEVRVAYAIGVAAPLAVTVDTFGTGDPRRAREFVRTFDFRPGAVIERLDLLRPLYRRTTNYGHFGRPGLPWEG